MVLYLKTLKTMKLKLFFILSFFVTLSVNAENKTLSYKAKGKNWNVTIVDNSTVQVYVNAGSKTKAEPYFLLEGSKQIESFKLSLQKMKEIYAAWKTDPTKGTGANFAQQMPVKFAPFAICWTSDSGELTSGSNKSFIPTYAVTNQNTVFEASFSGATWNLNNPRVRIKCFLIFTSEEEIQSLIDVLPVFEEEPASKNQSNTSEDMSTSKERLPGESYARYVERLAKLGCGIK